MTERDNGFTYKDGVNLEKQFEKVCESRREVINEKIQALTKIIEQAVETIEKETERSAENLERRLVLLNELRDMVNEWLAKLITRDEAKLSVEKAATQLDAEIEKIKSNYGIRIQQLEKTAAEAIGEARGKASVKSVIFAAMIGVVGLLISIIQLVVEVLRVP